MLLRSPSASFRKASSSRDTVAWFASRFIRWPAHSACSAAARAAASASGSGLQRSRTLVRSRNCWSRWSRMCCSIAGSNTRSTSGSAMTTPKQAATSNRGTSSDARLAHAVDVALVMSQRSRFRMNTPQIRAGTKSRMEKLPSASLSPTSIENVAMVAVPSTTPPIAVYRGRSLGTSSSSFSSTPVSDRSRRARTGTSGRRNLGSSTVFLLSASSFVELSRGFARDQVAVDRAAGQCAVEDRLVQPVGVHGDGVERALGQHLEQLDQVLLLLRPFRVGAVGGLCQVQLVLRRGDRRQRFRAPGEVVVQPGGGPVFGCLLALVDGVPPALVTQVAFVVGQRRGRLD